MRTQAIAATLLVGSQAVGVVAFVLPFTGLSWEKPRGDVDILGPMTLPIPQHLLQPSTGFVAFGDSYSAGIGTGINGTENACRRGLGSHAQLIHRDFVDLVGEDQTSFQHLSCTGATLSDLLSGGPSSQIDDFDTTTAGTTADFALLSIGGNDLGFFDVLNSCIFRFYSFYSGTCESALERSEEQIRDPAFEEHLRLAIVQILDRVRWEKRLWFTVTVTGYARFFNDETDECDDSSFGVWWRGPKLKRELRQRVNRMVRDVNRKIKTSVDAINARFAVPRVLFVDYDAAFEGHRFCEPNVTEPDYARNETWFFLVGGHDNGENGGNRTLPEQPPPEDNLTSSSPLIDPDKCLEQAQRSGDWGELALCLMAMAVRDDPTIRTVSGEEFAAQNSMWHAPTYYGKTFHPRSEGHLTIRNKIYSLWRDQLRAQDQVGEL